MGEKVLFWCQVIRFGQIFGNFMCQTKERCLGGKHVRIYYQHVTIWISIELLKMKLAVFVNGVQS